MAQHFSFASLAHRPSHRSSIGDWFKSHRLAERAHSAKHHIGHGVNAVRQGGEAMIVGGLLGVINAKMGLRGWDGLVGLLGLTGAVVFAKEDYATDMRNMGAAAVAVYSFRQGDRLMSESILKSGGVPKGLSAHGEAPFGADGEDPILAVAREIRR